MGLESANFSPRIAALIFSLKSKAGGGGVVSKIVEGCDVLFALYLSAGSLTFATLPRREIPNFTLRHESELLQERWSLGDFGVA